MLISPDFNDLVFFLGCLLYPKDIRDAMKRDGKDGEENGTEEVEGVNREQFLRRRSRKELMKDEDGTFRLLHSALYNFTLT